MITEKDGFWVDENNNKWDKKFFTKDKSKVYSETMMGCSGCINCHSCHYCVDCSNSSHLIRCVDCESCHQCENCQNLENSNHCRQCYDSKECFNCDDCTYCISCHKCHFCKHCKTCHQCVNCYKCSYCQKCDGIAEFKKNPQRYFPKPMGHEHSNTAAYWTNKSDLVIVCGCFYGDINYFFQKVTARYGDTHEYHDFIKEINNLIK